MRLNDSVKMVLAVVAIVIVITTAFNVGRKILGFRGEEILFQEGSNYSSRQANVDKPVAANGPIYVHVAGSVRKPGVYSLKAGTRVFQALKAAGGTTDSADTSSFNLAAPVEDGAKLYVPAKGENITMADGVSGFAGQNSAMPVQSGQTFSSNESSKSRSSSSVKFKTPGEGYVDINQAGSAELTRLPGVGPSTAAAIIEYRNRIGRFTSPQQLMDVKGIGPKKLAKMQPFIVCR